MIVLDTSFLVAYANEDDANSERAFEVMPRIVRGDFGGALLPEYVLMETATVLAARKNLALAVEMCDRLLASREIELVPCHGVLSEALGIFRSQARKRLSFADAAIVAIARQRGATHIATFDTDFRGSGFDLVP